MPEYIDKQNLIINLEEVYKNAKEMSIVNGLKVALDYIRSMKKSDVAAVTTAQKILKKKDGQSVFLMHTGEDSEGNKLFKEQRSFYCETICFCSHCGKEQKGIYRRYCDFCGAILR